MGEAFLGSASLGTERREERQLACANCGEPLPLDVLQTVLTCETCGQGHRSLPPPSITEPTEFEVGERVAVMWGNHWWSAHVVEMLPNNQRRVHYEGWAPTFDETVDNARIRAIGYKPPTSIVPPKFERKLKVKHANMASALGIVAVFAAGIVALMFWAFGPQVYNPNAGTEDLAAAAVGGIFDSVPGTTISPDTTLEVGQSVFVKWGDGWYQGVVLSVSGPDSALIRYLGWGETEDENVSLDRLRLNP